MITISKSQLPLVRELTKAYVHPSMYYKLGLEPVNLNFDAEYKNIPELNQFSSDCFNYKDIFDK
jgi:hypothetical protein